MLAKSELRQCHHQIGADAQDDEPPLSFVTILSVMLAGAMVAVALFAAFPTLP